MLIFIKKFRIMTLVEIINNLQQIALTQPNVRTVTEGDIYQVMNENPSVVYDVFHLTQQTHAEDEDFDYYRFNLFYVSRLVDDYDNRLQIQSIGKSVLSNIIRIFCERFEIDFPDNMNLTYVSFQEKFCDLTAGVYCNVVFQIPKNLICGDGDELPTIEITENGTYIFGGYKIKINVE